MGYFEKNIGEKPLSQSMSGIWLPYDNLLFIAILKVYLIVKKDCCFNNYAFNHSNNLTIFSVGEIRSVGVRLNTSPVACVYIQIHQKIKRLYL